MNTPEGIDRRRYVRQRLASLAYVELGKDNGGIALNLSEGGLSVAAAAPMVAGAIPRIRFRLPGSAAWIEAWTEIAWMADSKKEAGISFVDLAERDRTRIREWIFSPVPAIPGAPASGAVIRPQFDSSVVAPAANLLEPEPVPGSLDRSGDGSGSTNLPDRPSISSRELQITQPPAPAITAPAPAASGTSVSATVAPPTDTPALRETPARETPVFGASLLGNKAAHTAAYAEERWERPKDTSIHIEFRVSRWIAIAAVVVFVALASFFGGMAAGRGSWSGLLGRFTRWGSAAETSDHTASDPQNPASDPDVLAPDFQGASSQSPAQSRSPGSPNLLSRSLSASPAQSATQNSSNPQVGPTVGPSTPAPEGFGSMPNAPRGQSQSNPSASLSSIPVQPERGLTRSLETQPRSPSPQNPSPDNLTPHTQSPVNQSPVNAQNPSPLDQAPINQAPLNQSNLAPFQPSAPAPATIPAPTASATAPAGPPSSATSPMSPAASRAAAPPAAASSLPTASARPATVATPVPALPPASSAPAPAPNSIGTVEVVTTPYPSIRVPPALQGSQSEALRIGELTTRIDPAYPPEALHKGIQGVVQLHILIGADGAVTDMQVVRGPELFIPATRAAVGRWRYQPTLLGTEAVQTEADVTVSFKLGSPAPK